MSETNSQESNLSTGTFIFGILLGGLTFGITYGLCLWTAEDAAKLAGKPQDTALWTGACVALGTVWVALAADLLRQAIRLGLLVGISSGMLLDGMGAPVWLAVGLPAILGLGIFWLHRKKEDVEGLSDVLK